MRLSPTLVASVGHPALAGTQDVSSGTQDVSSGPQGWEWVTDAD